MKTFDYKYILSKMICRFQKYIKDTDCTWAVLLAVSIALGIMINIVPLMTTINPPSFSSICFGIIWTSIKMYVYSMSISYAGYELFHGLKWLGRWAENYSYTHQK